MNDQPSRDHTESLPDAPLVVGTAGHVDHGKSTLVRALTGMEPDRLAEEQQRKLTIDLGFAWLTLPSGRSVSIIDVPGHERFVRNMLAGVGGIDLAMLVIAADDGPMPQTREHLAILNLLGISHGVIVVSRSDLVDDEWRELVIEEIRELVAPTTLGHAPIVAVSAVTGDGLDALTFALEQQLENAQRRDSTGQPRLPIDRAFQVPGFGTVVTGTLIGGEIETGQELMLYPDKRGVRVRGIQAHEQQVDRVSAGSRVALNLSGIDHHEVQRGHVLAVPGFLNPSMRIDSRISVLEDAPVMLEQNDEVIVFTGATEVPARLTLLDRERIGPGDEGWVQLRLAHPVVVLRGDRLILRRPSPAVTIGGGTIVDPEPTRHRRFQNDVINNLSVLAEGTPEDLVVQELGDRPMELGELARTTGLDELQGVVQAMIKRGDVVALGAETLTPRTIILRTATLDRLITIASSYLDTYHAQHPLSAGPRRDEFRDVLGRHAPRASDEVLRELERRAVLRSEGAYVVAPEFRITLNGAQRHAADAFIEAARSAQYSPPAPQSFGVSDELLSALEATGELVQVADQIAYPADVFEEIQSRVTDKLAQDTTITLAEYRDMFDTSRKYAQPTLEYLDEKRVTRRKGDVRVRYRGPGAGGV